MARSHRRYEYLDLPDRPNSATKLDQVFGRGTKRRKGTSARPIVDHTRSIQYTSGSLQDYLPTQILTSTRPQPSGPLSDVFPINTTSRTFSWPRPNLYPTYPSILFGIQLTKDYRRNNIMDVERQALYRRWLEVVIQHYYSWPLF